MYNPTYSPAMAADPYKWCYLPITIRILNSGTRNKLFGLSGIYLAAQNTTDGTTSEFIISLNTLPPEVQSSSLNLEVYFTTNQLINNKNSGDSSIQWIQCKVIDWINFQNESLEGFLANGFKFQPDFNEDGSTTSVQDISSSILVAKPKYKFIGSMKPSGIVAKEISLVGTSLCEQNCDLDTQNLPIQISLEVCPFGLSNVSIFSGYTSNGFINYKSKDGSLYLSDIKYLDNMDGGIANMFVDGYQNQHCVFSLGLVLGNIVKRDASGELMVILSWSYIMGFIKDLLDSELSHLNYLTRNKFTTKNDKKSTKLLSVAKLSGNQSTTCNNINSFSDRYTSLQNLQTCYCSARVESKVLEAGSKAFRFYEGLENPPVSIFPFLDSSSVVAITSHHSNGGNFWGSGVKLSHNIIVTNRHVTLDENNEAPRSLKIWGNCLPVTLEIIDPQLDKDLYLPFEGKVYDICYVILHRDKNPIDFNLKVGLESIIRRESSSRVPQIGSSALSVGFGLFFHGLQNERQLSPVHQFHTPSLQTNLPLHSKGYISANVRLPIFESINYDVSAMLVASCSCWAGSSGGGVFQLDEINKTQTLAGIMVSNGKLSNGETLNKFNLIIPLDIVVFGLYDLFVEKLVLTSGVEKQLDSLWQLRELYKDVFMESSKL